MKKSFIAWLILILASPLAAGQPTIHQLRAELQRVSSRIEIERVRYQEAKAKMERSELVAKYLLPELKVREKDLEKKIRDLEKAKLE